VFDVDLYQEILTDALSRERIVVSIPALEITAEQLLELKSYQALQKIKAVIQNDSLDDSECFMRIEEIIHILEETGSSGGNRHDFG
jgi:hypothetical protein